MARPKNDPASIRDQRLTVYLTAAEAEELEAVARHKDTDKTKIVVSAVRNFIDGMAQLPLAIVASKNAAIMEISEETVQGYICKKGHVFWLDEDLTSPLCCPHCGNRNFKSTWYGTIRKGFR